VANVGLMLYTVRGDCADDLEGTLRAVAGMGYEGVELFDLHGHEAGRVRGWLDELALPVCGRHAGLDALESSLPALADELATLGTDRLILSWIDPPASSEAAWAVVERLRHVGERAAAHGLRLGFHNHDGELRPLAGGRTFLDELLDGAPELFIELDLGWAWYAGRDPVEVLERVHGRCPLVHVKDFRARADRSFCPVGDGAVGYERVAPAAVRSGVEWLLVEQDEADGPALEAVRRSLSALRQILGDAG
jgi:sugar phosphate isomerase/epimerase